MQIDFLFRDTASRQPHFRVLFRHHQLIDSPGIFLYETYVIVILRDLATGTRSSHLRQDANGHALSVAPPNLGPNSTPNYESDLGQPRFSRWRTVCACSPVRATTLSISIAPPPSTP